MQKTMYIPKGQICKFEDVACENIIVNGSLHVTNGIKAKHIQGDGVIVANVIQAETLIGNYVDAGMIRVKELAAKHLSAVEIHASESLAAAVFLEAGLVKTPKLTIADAEVEQLVADEVIKLSPRNRGLLKTLLLSCIRSVWLTAVCWLKKEFESIVGMEADFVSLDDDENEAETTEEHEAEIHQFYASRKNKRDAA